METKKLELKEIRNAISDLKKLIAGNVQNIVSVSLFGSTVDMHIDKAEDIDFFIAYKNSDFDMIRNDILTVNIGRNIIVESHEAQYTNHPTWTRETPLRIHIILYRDGISEFSEKLLRTRKSSIDITHLIK